MPQTITRADEYRMRVAAATLGKRELREANKRLRVKAQLPVAANAKADRPDPIVKAEFEPDNSRIGCESKGIQTQLDLDTLAAIWVYEWHVDLEREMLRPYVPTAPMLRSTPYVVVREAEHIGFTTTFDNRKHIDGSLCAINGEWMLAQINPARAEETPKLRHNENAARQESMTWKTNRTPRNGQRPQPSRQQQPNK